MEKDKKKWKKPLWLGVISALTAGAVMATTSGLQREGVRVREYPSLAPKAYCTVLVYMDGSDLESDYGAAAEDLKEMEQAVEDAGMASDTLQVVVEAGGAAEWQYDAMRDKEYGRFCLTKEGVQREQELEARNMGSADTLADFINYGTQSYPAEHYGLVMWNHGAGQIEGFGSDSNFESDSLPLADIKKAMELSDMKVPFDFVSLDACLMGNLELVSVLENKTEYLIASEELEPQNGYDYGWLKTVAGERKHESGPLGRAVGEAMLTSYESSYTDKEYKLTLSLIDMAAYDGFHNVFHQVLANALEHTDENFYNELGQMRRELQGFGNRQEGMTAEIVDVMDLLDAMGQLGKDETLGQQVKQQIEKLVPERITKGYPEEPSGLSIYLPSGANDWLQDDMAVYDGITFCELYQEFLHGYRDYLVRENKMEWRSPSRDKNTIRLDITPDQIEEISGAYLTTFCKSGEGITYLLSTDSDVTINRNGFLKATPSDTYWGLKGQVLCLVEIMNTDQYTEYRAPILYNDELCTIHIGFDEEHPDGAIQTVVPTATAKKEYELQKGDVIVPLYPLEDETENTEMTYQDSYYKGEPVLIEDLERGDAVLEQITVDPKQCSYGFLIQDTKQKTYVIGNVGLTGKERQGNE